MAIIIFSLSNTFNGKKKFNGDGRDKLNGNSFISLVFTGSNNGNNFFFQFGKILFLRTNGNNAFVVDRFFHFLNIIFTVFIIFD